MLLTLLLLILTQLPFCDEALDERLKLMQEVVKTIRIMKADYLSNNTSPEGTMISFSLSLFFFVCVNIVHIFAVYAVCKTAESADTLREFGDTAATLSRCSKYVSDYFF